MLFTTDLSAGPGLAYLRDHVVSGRPLMPGTGCEPASALLEA